VKAYKVDTQGNLVFRGTARNSNPDCAVAGKVTIAEDEIIVPARSLDPDEVHCPGIFADNVVLATKNEKQIEHLQEQPTKISVLGGAEEGDLNLKDMWKKEMGQNSERERIVRCAGK
jgi:acyl CoA:acetate/3-ketoacid CoA transferase